MAPRKNTLPSVPQGFGLADLESALAQAKEMEEERRLNDLHQELGVKWNKEATEIFLPGRPKQMTLPKAIRALQDFQELENQVYTIHEFFTGMPHDAAHAFVQVLKARYGWVNPQTKQTIFGPQPPQMVTVRTGASPEDFVEVPVGEFKLPDISVNLETGFDYNPSNRRSGSFVSFFLHAEVKHEDRKIIQELIAQTRAYLEVGSIYRGKAMRLPVDSSGSVESNVAPIFIDLSGVDPRGLVLTRQNEELLNHTVWTPIRHTQRLRDLNISRKRGALLYGPYGTGKTLSALVTAKLAIENGWTFIMLDKPEGLVQALEMAKLYQPAVVFAEDIDRVVDKRRGDDANDVLNTIDGALSKSAEVITVLTTNHIENIAEAMLRPGRLDAVIEVTLPDADAAKRLVRLYAGDLLDDTVDLSKLGGLVAGFIPAVIAEVVNRSKLGMIARGDNELAASDLEVAAVGLKEHAKLLERKEPEPSPEEQLGISFKKLLGSGVNDDDYDGSSIQEDIEGVSGKAEAARQNSYQGLIVVKRELPVIRKLLEAHAESGGANGTGSGMPKAVLADIQKKLDAIVKAAGVRVN